jgi:mono/diheme cytochrome c family protein
MSRSQFWSLAVVPVFVLLAGVNSPAAHAQRPEPARTSAKPEAAPDDKIARGRYIVESVAMCGRCHSPVDEHGNRDAAHWLQGGAVGINPSVPTNEWAIIAPRIAGAPPGTDEEFVHLLMTGISRRGLHLRQPMPQFRMTQADAEAVLAYLKSLPGRPTGTH